MSQISMSTRESLYSTLLKTESTNQTTYTRVGNDEMTMDEYKKAIQQKIFQMPLNNGKLSCNQSVKISDEGYQAMKNDPQYEKWVLSTIEGEFTKADPRGYTMLNKMQFGATPEEFSGDTLIISSEGEKERIKEERQERLEERKEDLKKRLEKQATIKKLRREMYISLAEAKSLERHMMVKQSHQANDGAAHAQAEKANKKADECANAILAYEMNFILEELCPTK